MHNKINILFVCHGNICRSPMAEFLFKKMVDDAGLSDKYYIESAAISYEEQGNHIHNGTKKILDKFGIDASCKTARRIEHDDYDKFDYIIVMDKSNLYYLNRIVEDKESKVFRLLDFSDKQRDISDPWYTHDFDTCYNDINEGLKCFFDYLENKEVL